MYVNDHSLRTRSSTQLGEISPVSDTTFNYRRNSQMELERRAQIVRDQLEGVYIEEERVVPKKGIFDKIKFGFKYLDSKFESLDSIYVKYHDKAKRKVFWTMWEKRRNKYSSYKEFKESWNPNTNIWNEMKKDVKNTIKSEVEKLLDQKHPFDRALDPYNSRRNHIKGRKFRR